MEIIKVKNSKKQKISNLRFNVFQRKNICFSGRDKMENLKNKGNEKIKKTKMKKEEKSNLRFNVF